MLFKNCERCGGDIYVERQIGETDLVCLQCGYRRTMDVQDVLRRSVARTTDRKPVPARPAAA